MMSSSNNMMTSRATSTAAAATPMPSREDFTKLPEDQQNQINDAFAVFDADKDGRIDYHEFRFALRALGFDLPKPETYAYLTKYAIMPVNWRQGRECGPVFREFTLPMFQGIAGTLVFNRDPVEESIRAYRLFDVEGKGMITVEDLQRVMQEIGQDIDDAELNAMINEFDSEGRGGVNQDEFVKIMLRRWL